MANSLFPAFFKMFYHSDVASHVATIPMREWTGTPGGFEPSNFLSWDLDEEPADTMIEAFIDAAADAFFNDQVTIDGYTIFSFPDEDSDPLPVFSKTLSVPGTLVDTGWYRAVQTTYIWRTTEFGLFKLVTLDGPSGDSFEDSITWASAGVGAALHAIVSSPDNAFAGRDNGRPVQFLRYSRTLNDRALAKYGDNPLV